MSIYGQTGGGCTVYLMRHGDSRTDHVRRFIGHSDHPLNDTGRAQAGWWRRELAQIQFSTVCCSALKRSVETARIVSGKPEKSLWIMPELCEIDLGKWDGMSVSDVRRLHPEEYARRGADLAGYRPEGGDSFTDLSDCVLPAFEELVRQSSGNVLVAGHAGVNRVILCHLLGMPLANLFRLDQQYGCMNILEYRADSWVVRGVNMPAKIE